MNDKICEFFSEDALDEMPDIDLKQAKGKTKSSVILGQEVYVYADFSELKGEKMDDALMQNVLAVLKGKRTESISKHFPHELREAVDEISEREILNDMDNSLLQYDREKSETERKHQKMIEDLFYDGSIKPFFKKIKKDFGDRKPDTRTREQVEAIFKNKYEKYLNKYGGVIYQVSQNQLKLIDKGLPFWFIPSKPCMIWPKKAHDWKIFFLLDTTFEITRVGFIVKLDKVKFGKFRTAKRDSFILDGYSTKQVIKLYTDWVKGIGGDKQKGRKSGSSLDVICIIFKDLLNYNSINYESKELKISLYKIISIKETRVLYQKYTEKV
ncbi:MAG: hypothetical protein GPJ54_11595 [Candidatus Heimdallarchaeota archaeon]|nr:hypothetical protein [Candidatus Heimdallarchaeota archaeon]